MLHGEAADNGVALPLSGMRVLDLSRALSGPFCSQILADLGADVVKVEPLPKGDMIRTWGPFDRGESVYFLSGNRNKRSIAINFWTAGGRTLLREMSLKSDVIVENFLPGTMANIGLDPVELQAEKPGLIVASISGFGNGGPLGDRPGFDQIAQGFSGFMSVTGTAETGPTRVGVAIGDMASGMWLAIGVLSAWIVKLGTGRGQQVSTSLLGALLGLLSVQGQRYLSLGEIPQPTGNVHPVIAPYGVFRAGDGDMNIGAATQEMWLSLCDVIGMPQLKADPRFTDNAHRMQHREELKAMIEAALVTKNRSEWTELLVKARIPAGPINTIKDALNEAQVQHLNLVETVPHATLGELRQVSNPLSLASHPSPWIRSAPPLMGQHSREILQQFGFDDSSIAGFEAAGIVGGGMKTEAGDPQQAEGGPAT